MLRPPVARGASTPRARPPTTKMLKPFGFSVLGPIASGAYSTVVHARHKESGTEVAIKTFAKCGAGTQESEESEERRGATAQLQARDAARVRRNR